MKHNIIIGAMIIALSICLASSNAAMIKGKLTDSQTGEPVAGAFIKLAGTEKSAISDTNGEFAIADLTQSEARLVVSVIGYEVAIRKVDETEFEKVSVALVPSIVRGQDIVVTATRATAGETPSAFSNLSSQDLEERYWAQDIPVLLSGLPNANFYSDAGNGIGYSYLKIRGFDQKRIAVMLNGIPLNDAESHEVFWVDLPDFASSARDIQVQRGVGSSLYGASALGGSVNLITGEPSLLPSITVESGLGSYDTRKFSVEGSSGLIDDYYSFYGRFSRIETDGYRENSWTKMYSYFIGVTRFDENMTWRFNTYGGPEESHLAYKGITIEHLNNNRRFNELQFEGEIDHFNQPHYELLNDVKLNERVTLSNTLYYFNGDGHYTQLRNRRDIEQYFPGYFGLAVADSALAPRDYYDLEDDGSYALNDDSLFTILKTDLIRRPTVAESDWGWIPRATYKHSKGDLTIGGEIRIHAGHHFGEVIWASVYPSSLPSNIRFYDYKTKSNNYSAFVLETFRPVNSVMILANLQYQRHFYRLLNDRRFDVVFKRNFDSLSPRVGVSLNLVSDFRIYGSISTASRQPAFKDIFDPTDYWSNPGYKPDNFRWGGGAWDYAGKELKAERLLDYELGTDFSVNRYMLPIDGGINLYRMEITNEILPYAGQIDDMGYPISGNAEKAIHQGVEISVKGQLPYNLAAWGNLSFTDDHFARYKEYGFDYDNWVAIEYDRSGKRIGGYPEYLSNARIEWNDKGISCGLNARFVGTLFIDNGEQHRLGSFSQYDMDLSYQLGSYFGLKRLLFAFRINNVSDEKLVPSAYIEPDDNLPRYIVGAERNVYFSLKASL
jgi:iron complex outermembrane receptor protein